MVDAATGQAVVGCVRAAELKPADVRRFQPQVPSYPFARRSRRTRTCGPMPIPRTSGTRNRERWFEPSTPVPNHGASNFTVQGLGEMSSEDIAGDFADRLGPPFQFVEYRRRKPAGNPESP